MDQQRPVQSEISDESIFQSVEKVIGSAILGRHSKLPKLLRHIVERELEGRGRELKGYSIATEVLGRNSDFDPATDSIVRVEMRRLRQALQLYYATEGVSDPIRITIQTGGYRPTFQQFLQKQEAETSGADIIVPPEPGSVESNLHAPAQPAPREHLRTKLISAGITFGFLLALGFYFGVVSGGPSRLEEPIDEIGRIRVMLDPISASEDEPILQSLSFGLQRQLLAEMGSARFMQVSRAPDTFGSASLAAAKSSIHVRIHLQRSPTYVRAILDLVSPAGVALWGNIYNVQWETPLGLQDEMSSLIVADLRPQLLMATRRLSDRMSSSKFSKSVWQSYVQATWFPTNSPLTLEWEKQRIEVARKAISANLNFGPAHAILAQKIALLAPLDPAFRREDLLVQAEEHATRAMELSPDDPDAMFHVALYYWYRGRFLDASSAFRRVLDIEPSNFMAKAFESNILFSCKDAPPDVIADLEKRDRELTPDNPSRWMLLVLIGTLHANAGNWENAEHFLRMAYFQHLSPETFIPLATVLNHRGQKVEALVHLRLQQTNWPNLDMKTYADQPMFNRCDGGAAMLPMKSAYLEFSSQLHGEN